MTYYIVMTLFVLHSSPARGINPTFAIRTQKQLFLGM